MSDLKDQDPDYGPSVVDNERHRRIYEENARSTTARKIMGIVEREFSQEISSKEKEVLEIQERLHGALKTLHLLRYVIIADFYNRKQCQASAAQPGEQKQTQIHPAIKRLIGKSPKNCDSTIPSTSNGTTCSSSRSSSLSSLSDSSNDCEKMGKGNEDGSNEKRKIAEPPEAEAEADTDTVSRAPPRKVPRYVPPRTTLTPSSPSRGTRHKCRRRVIVGNISKWIPSEWREDAASHKWTMYVRGSKEEPSLEEFVTKVRFFLHPSYRPNDVVEVTGPPFCLSRRGWGEFPLRVQLHFRSALNKPMDIIHHLKLDRTYTGLQTLGAETLVDIWIYGEDRAGRRIQELRDAENDAETLKETDENSYRSSRSGNEDEVRVKVEKDSGELDRTFVKQYEGNDTVTENVEMKDIGCLKNETNTETEINKSDEMEIDVNKDIMDIKIHEEDAMNLNDEEKEETRNIKKTENRTFVENEVEVKTEMDERRDIEKFILSEQKDMKIEKDLMEIGNKADRTRYNVELDHDYLGPKTKEEPLEDSTTEKSDVPANETATKEKLLENQTDESHETPNEAPILNTVQTKNESVHRSETPNLIRPFSPSKFRSNLRPLKISIPPAFESTMSKRVLVVQNDKTIPIDVSVCKTDVKPRKSTIAPGSSLLKPRSTSTEQEIDVRRLKLKPGLLLNVNYDVPALKIAETRLFPEQRLEDRQNCAKITLGKDKHKLHSNRECYEEVFRAIENVRISDVRGLIKFAISRLPIVTKDAEDLAYRRLHPYACKSEEEYFEYSLAKRRALEWSRAKLTWNLLREKCENLWSVKEIVVWTRVHGYAPLCSSLFVKTPRNEPTKNLSESSRPFDTISEPLTFQNWLTNCSEKDEGIFGLVKEDESIEILEIEEDRREKSVLRDEEVDCERSEVTVMELESRLVPLHNLVCETASQIGVKLSFEEIVPGVVHCAAGRVVMKAAECFVDELVRMSLAKAWERYNESGYPKVVSVEDVRRAISSREEFDILTNEGLGTKHRSTGLD